MNRAALQRAAGRWIAERRAACEVQVATAHGSVPREAGTRMLVAADEVLGTIGGGHLEWQAIEHARARLAAGDASVQERRYALGPSLGQCCGGALTLGFRPLDTAALAQWPPAPPRFVLQLFGAGHVGRAIVRLLEDIDCRVRWIDERDSEFPAAPSAPHVERVCVEPVEAEVDEAAPGTFFLVLTHRHDLDLAIGQAILARADFGFFGLIGSASKRARFVRRFEQRGIEAATIGRMICPIGLAGLRGKEPEIIAVSVVAQLLVQAQGSR